MLFKDYDALHKGIDTGIYINGKTIDNYRPEDVKRLLNSLPPILQTMMRGKLQDAIMGGEDGYPFDESRRIYHFQPDFTDLRKSLKKRKTLYLYVHRKKDGTLKMTDQEQQIYAHKGRVVTHHVDCPACGHLSRRGVIGTDYCSVCWGQEFVKVTSKVVVVECNLKVYNKLKGENLQGFKTEYDERRGYPDWTPIKDIRNKTALTWDDIDEMC